jgi:ABC-type glycerol-3-phosphate transport system permease component
MNDRLPRRLYAWALLAFATFLTLYPVVWMLSASLKDSREIFTTSPLFLGSRGLGNYVAAFRERPFFVYLLNSVFAAGASVAITIVLGALAGYSFAKFRYRVAPLFWLVVLVSVMIPLEAIVIPLFLEVHSFGWTNTYAGLIMPTAFNVVGIFVFRQAIVAIPDAYIEAARIDGAGELRILRSVVLPMVGPAAVVVAVLTFNLAWNSYLWPLIVTSDDLMRTLPLGMAAFQAGFDTKYGEVMAVSVFGALPTAIFFLALQRYFEEGAIASGIK